MDILTPFQIELLKSIGASDLANDFYLTGGTALAAFYLQHRYSEDLDFFTANPNALRFVATYLNEIVKTLSATVEFTRTFNTFIESFVTSSDGERIKLDFAYDTPYRLRPTELHPLFNIQIDNFLDISANKLAALFDRAAEKDFVDVYFINQELMPFSDLLSYARQKQVGMDDYWLAIACQRVQRIKLLPRMLKQITVVDLQTYFLEVADSLMRHINRLK